MILLAGLLITLVLASPIREGAPIARRDLPQFYLLLVLNKLHPLLSGGYEFWLEIFSQVPSDYIR